MSLLAEAVSDGRLTLDEHAQRLEEASSARTLGELARLTTDLVTPDAQPLRLDGTRPVAAVFGGQRREGRWVVPERLAVAAVFGEALLDFREALLQSSRVIVYATVVCGRLKILVPDGVAVEVTGTSLATSRRGPMTRRRPLAGGQPGGGASPGSPVAVPGQPDLPVIEVRGLMLGGRVQAIAPPRSRGFLGIFPRRGR